MRQLLVLLASLLVISATGQPLEVHRIEQRTHRTQGHYAWPRFLPTGNDLLVSSEAYAGLYRLPVSGGPIQTISTHPGAGMQAVSAADGSLVAFTTHRFVEGRRLKSLYLYGLQSGELKVVESDVRHLSAPSFRAHHLHWQVEGKKRQLAMDQTTEAPKLQLHAHQMQLWLSDSNGERAFRPNGPGNYIWASLSPDATKVLYYFGAEGAFVADLQGNILARLGRLQAPVWRDNNWIVAMDDRYANDQLVQSEIVAYHLATGQKTTLTHTPLVHEQFPAVSPDGSTLAVHSQHGEVFLLHLR